jgi:ligand-binding SRPBCC domain-containing protein
MIELETKIAAPAERCFLLSLSIDLHTVSAAQTRERAVAGVTHGLIGPGETVTWEGRHFCVMLRHETVITKYDRPTYFQDVMVKGSFRSFVHDHFFETAGSQTLMRERLEFSAPLGQLGWLAETILLRRYLEGFLVERNTAIKRVAEGEPAAWQRYLPGC